MMRNERVKMERNKGVEMMLDIYENAETMRCHDHHGFMRTNTKRHQPLQHTGSVSVKNRKHTAAEVCLCLLCVLLLTAVIVICVCYTSERKHLLTHIHNLTEERVNILNQNIDLTEEKEQIMKRINKLNEEREQIKNKTDQMLHAFYEQVTDQLEDKFKWIYHNFSFYYISPDKKGWSDSRRYCEQRGADLLIIKSLVEQEFLQKVVVDGHFWIGLTKTEGMWKWTDDTTVTNEYWSSQTQDFYSFCAVMTSSGWKEELCTSVNKWICKRPILVLKAINS